MEYFSKNRRLWVPSRRACFYWGIVVLTLVVVVVNGMTGLGADISRIIHENDMMDKVGHLVFFGVLSFLINRGLRLHLTCSSFWVVLLSCGVAFLFGALDEYSQLWIRGRNFDYMDLWANFLGAALIGPFGCLTLDSRQPSSESVDDAFDESFQPLGILVRSQPSVFLSPNQRRTGQRRPTSTGHRRRLARKSPKV